MARLLVAALLCGATTALEFERRCGGCGSYIHMDDFSMYGVTGGSTSLQECATAVKRLNGTEGCLGECFFYEDAGFCNCPLDPCTEECENENAGGPGQLYCYDVPANYTCQAACPDVIVVWSTVLGAVGWAHWITFHAFCNGTKSLWDPSHRWTGPRAWLLILTLVLAVVQVSGGSVFIHNCPNWCGPHKPLAITYTVLGCWGVLWTTAALMVLSCKRQDISQQVSAGNSGRVTAAAEVQMAGVGQVPMATAGVKIADPTVVSEAVTAGVVHQQPPSSSRNLVDRLKEL